MSKYVLQGERYNSLQRSVGDRLQYWEKQTIDVGRNCIVVSKRDCSQIFTFLRQQAHNTIKHGLASPMVRTYVCARKCARQAQQFFLFVCSSF